MNILTLIRAANEAASRERHFDRLATAYAHAGTGEDWWREMADASHKSERYRGIADRARRRYTAKIKHLEATIAKLPLDKPGKEKGLT